MAIKKISQLDNLPAAKYMQDGELKADVIDKILFETSFFEHESTDAPSYYRSYNITVGDFKNMIGLDSIQHVISSLISGEINLGGTTIFGEPTKSNIDKDECIYWNDSSLRNNVIMYAPLSCNNLTKFYHNTEFHNDIIIKPNVTLSCQGNAWFDNPIHGIAMSAWWADLAEYYKADDNYEPGTLVEFAGDEEITIAKNKCNAVVTSQPGLVLNANSKDSNMTGIALAGRVPIKVIGKVKKFDNIILSDKPGIGIVNTVYENDKNIGKALESSDDEGIKLIECVTQFNLI